jgi:L-fuculose-phosphate aldolase
MSLAVIGTEAEVRKQLVEFGKRVHEQGFVAACDGNLSVRLSDDRVLATPSGVSKGMMTEADMVLVDMSGRNVRPEERQVSSEILMHLTIYRMRPDVRAVVHAHPVTATAFACSGMPLDDPICSEAIVSLGAVPLAEYATTGTPELSESLLPHIPDYDAILLANHGAVSYGTDLLKAYLKMEAVEHYALILMAAHQLGHPERLEEEDIRRLVEARRSYAGNGSSAPMPAGPLMRVLAEKMRGGLKAAFWLVTLLAAMGLYDVFDTLSGMRG